MYSNRGGVRVEHRGEVVAFDKDRGVGPTWLFALVHVTEDGDILGEWNAVGVARGEFGAGLIW